MDRDERLQAKRHKKWANWMQDISDIGLDVMLNWVSGFRDGMPCRLGSNMAEGGFNTCIPVRFEDGREWMVRIPKEGKCHHVDAKLLREVATMQYIHRHTSIPVPQVHAWGLSIDNELGLGPFIIMDHIRGVPLADLWRQQDKPRNWVGMIRSDIPEDKLR